MVQAIKQDVRDRHADTMKLATHEQIEHVPVVAIRVNGGTQMRAGLNAETVSEYAAAMQEYGGWGKFEPVEVYHDGSTYWLADGFHRVAAAKEAGIELAAAKVHAGDQRKAILHAAGANADHGLRRTNADRRRAVETLLRDKDWGQWSDAEIGRICFVDSKTVGAARKELVANQEIPDWTVRKTADGHTFNAANVGRKAEPEPENKPTPVQQTRDASEADKDLLGECWGDDILRHLTSLEPWGTKGDVFKAALERATLAQLQKALEGHHAGQRVYRNDPKRNMPPGGITSVEMIEARIAELSDNEPTTAPTTLPDGWEIEQLPDDKYIAKFRSPSQYLATERFDSEEAATAAAIAGNGTRALHTQWLDYRYLCLYSEDDPGFKNARERAPLWMLRDALAVAESKYKRKGPIEALRARIRKLEKVEPPAPQVVEAEPTSDAEPLTRDLIVAQLIDPHTTTAGTGPLTLHGAVTAATVEQLQEALRLMPDALRKGRGPVLEVALKKLGVAPVAAVAAPPSMPADLAAAGYRLVQSPDGARWGWELDHDGDGIFVDYLGNWLDTPEEAIEEARGDFIDGGVAQSPSPEPMIFGAWYVNMPDNFSLSECAVILELAKTVAKRALDIHLVERPGEPTQTLYNAVYGALPSLSHLIKELRKATKE